MDKPGPYSDIKMESWLDERVEIDPDKRLLAKWVKYLEWKLEHSEDHKRHEYEREVFDTFLNAVAQINRDLVAAHEAANHMAHTWSLHHKE